ncbi:unnamed protein product [Amoebophrya sp. A25]|nr:unnamed protein product [Amoebophrya sp. A25]|eukprot:GSA25T00000150001.1
MQRTVDPLDLQEKEILATLLVALLGRRTSWSLKSTPSSPSSSSTASSIAEIITSSSTSASKKSSTTPSTVGVGKAIWRNAMRNCRDARVWERLIDDAKRHLLFLGGGEILAIYYGLGRVRYRDPKFLKELHFQAIRQIDSFAPRGLALVLNSFRKLELSRDVDTFQLFLHQYLVLHERWSAWDVALVCNAVAYFHLYEPRLWKLIGGKANSRKSHVPWTTSGQQIINGNANNYNRLKPSSSAEGTHLQQHGLILHEMRPQGLALVTAAMARMDLHDAALLASIARAAIRQAEDFTASQLSILYAAMCRLDFDRPRLYIALENAAIRNRFLGEHYHADCMDHDSAGAAGPSKENNGEEKRGSKMNYSLVREREREDEQQEVRPRPGNMTTSEEEINFLRQKAAGRKIRNVSWCTDVLGAEEVVKAKISTGIENNDILPGRQAGMTAKNTKIMNTSRYKEKDAMDGWDPVLFSELVTNLEKSWQETRRSDSAASSSTKQSYHVEEDPDDPAVLLGLEQRVTKSPGSSCLSRSTSGRTPGDSTTMTPSQRTDGGVTHINVEVHASTSTSTSSGVANCSGNTAGEPFDLLALSMLTQACVCFTKCASRRPGFVRALLHLINDKAAMLRSYHMRKLLTVALFLQYENKQLKRAFKPEIDMLKQFSEKQKEECSKASPLTGGKIQRRTGIRSSPGSQEGPKNSSSNFTGLGEQRSEDFYLGEMDGEDGSEEMGREHLNLEPEGHHQRENVNGTHGNHAANSKGEGVDGGLTYSTSRWKREVFEILEKEMLVKLEPKALVHADVEDAVLLPERKTVAHCLGVYSHYANTTERTAQSKLHTYLLELQGFTVLHIPYYEWAELRSTEDKVLYLVSKGRQLAKRAVTPK